MPYQRSVLSLDEAHKAMDRMLQEAFKAPIVLWRSLYATIKANW